MNNSTARCLWIVLKIWVLAILLNAIAGTVVLSGPALFIPYVAETGAFFGAIYSLPVFILLLAELIFLVRKKTSFKNILLVLMATGTVSTCVALVFFFKYFGHTPQEPLLYVSGCGAGILAIISQVKTLKEITTYKNQLDELLAAEDSQQRIA